jgi:hypothetical protein
VRIRTLLDARPGSAPRFQLQTLVLAHSWAGWANTLPLEVFVIGNAPAIVDGRLRELGAAVVPAPSHPLDAVSKSSNKLVALKEPSDGPVLLVDNDACFLDDVSGLDGRRIRTTIGARARVSDTQWEHIRETTGLEPIEQEWVSLHGELKARRLGREPKVERRLYLSSAVSWIADPAEFESLWADGIGAIVRAFDRHPLSSYAVRGSDQAGFAVAVAQYGGLDLLAPAYNHRPVCFRLGLPDPKILHLGELGNLKGGMLPFSQLLTTWWDRRILIPIRRSGEDDAEWPSDEEQERLLDEAACVRDWVLALGRDAGLDAFDFRV